MAYKNPYSPLVVPEEWTGRLRQFGIQLRGIITDIFVRLRQNKEAIGKVNSAVGIVQDGVEATVAISSGQYVIWRGDLYQASSAIAIGDTLSADNLSPVTAGAVNALRGSLGAAAYQAVGNTLTRQSAGAVLDARQGRALNLRLTTLEENALQKVEQTLTADEQTQVRTNLGLGAAAVQAVANNLTTTAAGSVLDARQGKALKDSLDAIDARDDLFVMTGAETLAEALAIADASVTGAGARFGSANGSTAENMGLPSTPFHFMLTATSSSFRLLQAFRRDGEGVYYLEKYNGTWGTTWKTVNYRIAELEGWKTDFNRELSSITSNNATRKYIGIKFPQGYRGLIVVMHPMSGTPAAGLLIVSQSATTGSTCRISDVYKGTKLSHVETLGQCTILYNDTTTAAYTHVISLRDGYVPEKIVYGATQADVEALLAAE